jgi:hypothetical protein
MQFIREEVVKSPQQTTGSSSMVMAFVVPLLTHNLPP